LQSRIAALQTSLAVYLAARSSVAAAMSTKELLVTSHSTPEVLYTTAQSTRREEIGAFGFARDLRSLVDAL
jgi:hypothetical protein